MENYSDQAFAPLASKIDDAVALGSPQPTTAAIKRLLANAISTGEIRLPERFFVPREDTYARRLLHRDVERGWSAVVMTWGPGQGTPLHDHSGLWCVEGTIHGEMDVVQFEIAERGEDGRTRFSPRGRVRAFPGAAGALIPPFEYHVLRNGLADAVSVTLHVYGGEMNRCSLFEPDPDGWHHRVERPLAYHD
jgi:predicted metal-dependent enzyme (double-stranded beta helix superfamily)